MDIMVHYLFALFLIQYALYKVNQSTGFMTTFDNELFKNSVYYKYAPIEQVRLLYSIGTMTIVLIGVRIKDYFMGLVKHIVVK